MSYSNQLIKMTKECSIYVYRLLLCRTYHVLYALNVIYVFQNGSPKAHMSNYIYLNVLMWIQHISKNTEMYDYKDIRDVFNKDAIIQYKNKCFKCSIIGII
ncbi:hypothetical protein A9G12_07820 [Gilliamella sp. wkB112]|nr:hypothetical protein A9G12_07820 [Gilliamella apicola]